MNYEQAKQILGISQDDNSRSIKIKFRRLIGKYHPDAIGSESDEYTKKAQEINEAYQVVKKHVRRLEKKERENIWKADVNPKAYCDRNIYSEYHMDMTGMSVADERVARNMFQTITKGKYYWNPDEEDFSYFLKSLLHASTGILKKLEEASFGFSERELIELRMPYQVKLFQYLGLQFVRPLECLQKLADPKYFDADGRAVYKFRAFLGAKPATKEYIHILGLKKGSMIYPDIMQNDRIFVSDGMRKPLGFLSIEDDSLYFCLIPLLRAHKANVKMTVEAVECKRHTLPIKANVDFYVRIEKISTFENEDCTRQIETLLVGYRMALFRKRTW